MAVREFARIMCKRCGRDSDMTCPLHDPLDALLRQLKDAGYKPHFNEVDAGMARSALSVCTNRDARGRFDYIGMKGQGCYRAFWTCQKCSHWIEV